MFAQLLFDFQAWLKVTSYHQAHNLSCELRDIPVCAPVFWMPLHVLQQKCDFILHFV